MNKHVHVLIHPMTIQLLYSRNPFYRQTHLLYPLTHSFIHR